MRIFKMTSKETKVSPIEPNSEVQPSGSPEADRAPAAGTDDACASELPALMNGPVTVHVRGENGKFTLYDPQLGLLVTSDDLAEGHKRLMREREQRLREFAAAGMLAMLPGCETGSLPPRAPSTLKQLRPFLIKAVIVAGLMIYFLGAIGGALRDVGYNLEKQLDGVSHWTPDKVEMYREKSQRIADRLGPTMRALLLMFRDPAQNATDASGATGGAEGAQNATVQNNQTTPQNTIQNNATAKP